MDTICINLFDILTCLSGAIDLARPELADHHHQVAYLAYRLAEEMGLSTPQQRHVLIAGMVHDIGAFSVNERLSLIENEPVTVNGHAFSGARLLGECGPFAEVAETVRYHHLPWNHGAGAVFLGKAVPQTSHLLHLADRTCVLINRKTNVLSQITGIMDTIREKADGVFNPRMVKALEALAKKEYIWLELTYKAPLAYIADMSPFGVMRLTLDELVNVAEMFSQVVDFRSRFTATHSAGVAKTAEKLAELMGFSANECRMMLTAGYLHDLGKLAVGNDVLEKPSALSTREFDIMRSHTFYTYRLLEQIKGFETINQWASFHHERLDGRGYPFHLTDENLPLGSKVMAVADVFSAITEHRPYRKGMEKAQVVSVLQNMAEKRAISASVVAVVLEHFDQLTDICLHAEYQAEERYQRFCAEAG